VHLLGGGHPVLRQHPRAAGEWIGRRWCSSRATAGAARDAGQTALGRLDRAGVEFGLGSLNVFVQPPKLSLEAMATLFFSSRSIRTWNSSSAPLRSSSI
jgi:hypothetical protein